MIKVVVSDLSKTLVYVRDQNYKGLLNSAHEALKGRLGEEYPFYDYFGLNEQLLGWLEARRGKYDMHLFTDGTVQDHLPLMERLSRVFDFTENVHTPASVGYSKKDPRAYTKIVEEMGVKPEEVMFVDDNGENLEAARAAGVNVVRFETEAQAIGEMETILG